MSSKKSISQYDAQFDLFSAAEQVNNGGNKYKRTKTMDTEVSRGSSFGNSMFDTDFFPNISMNWDGSGMQMEEHIGENRAKNQPWIAKAGSMAGRIGAKTLAEVAKMPGVLGGIAAGSVGQLMDIGEGDDTDFMEVAFNNAWIKGINAGNEAINTDLFPVYVKKAVAEGNLWENITSIDFWATDGADGIGYILSMLAPGAAINRLSLGSKLFKAGAQGVRGTGKYVGLSGKVDDVLNTLSKADGFLPTTSKTADLWTGTVANTLFEAAAEAQGAMEGYESHLKQMLDSGEITQEEFDTKVKDKSTVGRDVFAANAAILIGPNAMMSKMIWGGPANKAIKNIAVDGKGLSSVAAPSLMSQVGKAGGRYGKALASEGFFEEGLQTTSEGYISNSYANDTDYDLGDFGKAYIDMLQTTEGQKAIFLGGFLGGGMMSVQGYKSDVADRASANRIVSATNDVINDVYSVFNEDVYKKDDNGNIIYRNGDPTKPELNFQKVIEKIHGNNALESMSAQYDMAIEQKDHSKVEAIREAAITAMVIPFIANQELGLDALKQHLEASADMAKIADREGSSKEEFVNNIMDKAKSMEAAFKTFDSYASDVIAVDHKDATKEDIAEFYGKLHTDYVGTKAQQHFLEKKIKESKDKLDKVLSEKQLSREEFDNNESRRKDLIQNDTRIAKLVTELSTFEPALVDIKKQAEKFWDSKSADKAFKEKINAKLDMEKASEEAEAVTATLENIKNAETEEAVDDILWPAGHSSFAKDFMGPQPATREEETTMIKDLTDRANATSNVEELEGILEEAKQKRLNFFASEKILDALESRIKTIVDQQQQFKKALEQSIEEYYGHETELNAELKTIESDLAELIKKQGELIGKLSDKKGIVNTNAPEVIVLFMTEAQDELGKLNKKIAELKKRKEKLQKDIASIKDNLNYLYKRYEEVVPKGFTSVASILAEIAANKEGLSEQRMQALELEYQVVQKEIMVEELTSAIDSLSYYQKVLEDSIKTYQAHKKKANPRQIAFLEGELKATLADLKETKERLHEESQRLKTFRQAFKEKVLLSELTKEESFWNRLRTAKKSRYKENIAAPVVKAKAAERKEGIREEKIAKELADKARHEAAIEAKKQAEAAKAEIASSLAGHYNIGEEFTIKPEHKLSKFVGQTGKITGFTAKGKVQITMENGAVVSITPKYEDTSTENEYKDTYSTEGGIVDRVVEENENKEDVKHTVFERRNNAKVMSTNESKDFEPFHFVDQSVIDYERSPINKKGQSKNFRLGAEQKRADGKPNTISDKAKAVAQKIIAGKELSKDESSLVYKDNNFEEIGIYVRNEALRRFKTKDFSDVNFLIDFLPLSVNLNASAVAPLETASLTKSKGFTEIFNSTSRVLREALIKEMVHNGINPEDLSTTIAGQFNGQLKVAPKVNDKVAENNIIDLYEFSGDIKKISADDFYIVDSSGVLKNPSGAFFPMAKKQAPGELFIAISTANGTKFPLKVNVKKIQAEEADVLYDLYAHRFQDITKGKSEKIADIDDQAIKDKVLALINKETVRNDVNGKPEVLSLAKLFATSGKKFEDISIKDVVDFFIWDATSNFKSQVRFSEGVMKVLDKKYSQEDFATPEAKAEFIQLLTENKRHQVRFAMRPTEDKDALTLQNRNYLEYMLKTGTINTNAIVGEPTFQGKTNIYLDTNKVKVKNKDSEFNQSIPKTYAKTLIGDNSKLKMLLPALFKKQLVLSDDVQYYIDPNEVVPEGKKQSKYRRVSILKQKTPKDAVNGNSPNMYNGGKRGDVIDNLMRDFFSIGFRNKEEFIQKANEYVDIQNKLKTKFGDIQISEEAFKDLYSILEDYKIEFDRMGLTVYSNVPSLHGTFTNKGDWWGNFAGTVDLLAQHNETGQWIIIDLKSSSIDRGTVYEGQDKDTYGYIEKDQIQQAAYAELFRKMTGISIKRLMIMPIIAKPNDSNHSQYTKITKSTASTPLLTIDNTKSIYELKGIEPISNIDEGKKKPTTTTKGKVNVGKLTGKPLEDDGTFPDTVEDNDTEGVQVDENVLKKGSSALDKLMKRVPKVETPAPTETTPKVEPKIEAPKVKVDPNKWNPSEANYDAIMYEAENDLLLAARDPKGEYSNIAVGARSYIIVNLETFEPITDKDAIKRILAVSLAGEEVEAKWKEVWDKRFGPATKTPSVTVSTKTVENNKEIVRKDEEKVVSLPKSEPQVDKLDFNKLSEEQAGKAIETLMDDPSMLKTIMTIIEKNETAPIQEQLREIFKVFEAENIAIEELRQRCKI